MTRRRPSPVTAVLAIVTAAALVTAVLVIGRPSSASSTRERMVTATRGVVQKTVSGSGTLEPSHQVELSFGASGTVTHVYVKVGDVVAQGQALARIDPSSAEADLAQARAQLQSAQDTLTQAENAASTASAATAATATTATATATAATTPTTTPTTTTAPTKTTRPSSSTPSSSSSVSSSPSSSSSSPQSSSQQSSTAGGGSTVSVAAAQASVTSAELSVRSAEKALAATTIVAPQGGTVAAVNGAVGENVTAGGGGSTGNSSSSGGSSPSVAGGLGGGGSSSSSSSSSSSGSGFITLVRLHRFRMDVSLSESDIASVRVGQAATVTVNAVSGEQFAAHVAAIGVMPSSSGSSSAVTYPVTLVLDQGGGKLKPGMSATADIVTAQASGITIPTQALTGSTVTVRASDGKRTNRTVQTGLTGDSSVQVVSGLKAGDQVVVRATTVTASTSTSGTGGGLGGGRGFGGGFGGGRGFAPPGGFGG